MTTPRLCARISARLERGAGRDDGFTLIEVIVSFAIFAVVAASAATAIYKAVHASHLSQQRTNAAGIAQSFIADAIAQANKNTAAPEAGRTVTTNVGPGDSSAAEEQFTVVRTITFDSGDTCSPGTLFTVNVVVSQTQTHQFLVRSDTKIACPPA